MYQPDEGWEYFADRLEQYFIVNKMAAAEDADRRRVILLTACGKTKYALMKDLVTPDKLKDKIFNELVEIVARHYKPKPRKIVSRYKFYTHGRKEGQSVSKPSVGLVVRVMAWDPRVLSSSPVGR